MQTETLKERTAFIRSKLFVPGSRPELFAKAAGSAADALSFDLEDSVTPDRKEGARLKVAAFLQKEAGTGARKLCIVRVNADAELLPLDVQAVVAPGLDVINLPKVESAEDVLQIVAMLEKQERLHGHSGTGLLANIETAKGVRLAHEIASAHPRVVGLQLGFLDLSMRCGIDAGNAMALDQVRLTLRLAATEAGIAAFDSAYADVKNADGFRAQADRARAMGLNGKSCIHPSQVALANEIFAPSAHSIEQSKRVLRAAEEASASGAGACLLDGKMIDAPIVKRARHVIERATRYRMMAQRDEAQD